MISTGKWIAFQPRLAERAWGLCVSMGVAQRVWDPGVQRRGAGGGGGGFGTVHVTAVGNGWCVTGKASQGVVQL